eukprot:4916181-Ditylum_brightwellii.AAC.1
MTFTALVKVLVAMGYGKNEKKAVKETVGTLQRMKKNQQEMLKESIKLTLDMLDELMALKEWYGEWTTDMGTATEMIKEVFAKELCDEFLDKKVAKAKEMREEASRLKLEE